MIIILKGDQVFWNINTILYKKKYSLYEWREHKIFEIKILVL